MKHIYLIAIVAFFTTAANATLEITHPLLKKDCESRLVRLQREPDTGQSISYYLQNFMGYFDLRFQVLESGTQVVLSTTAGSTLYYPHMKRIISTILKRYFGDSYTPNLPKRENSDQHLHGWIAQKPSTELIRKLYFTIQNLAEIPNLEIVAPYTLAEDVQFRRLAEHYISQKFPGVSDRIGMHAVLYYFPKFVNSLSLLDRLFADYSILTDEMAPVDQTLEKICAFVFGENVDSMSIRRKLRRNFLTMITEALPRYAKKGVPGAFEDISRPAEPTEFDELINESRIRVRQIRNSHNNSLKDKDGKLREFINEGHIGTWAATWLEHVQTDPEEVGDALIKLSNLRVSHTTMQKLKSTGAIYLVELLKWSAKDLVERFELTRSELIELVKELNVYGHHLHFNGAWDRDNFRIRRDHPEYYEHEHVPNAPWLRWDLLNEE